MVKIVEALPSSRTYTITGVPRQTPTISKMSLAHDACGLPACCMHVRYSSSSIEALYGHRAGHGDLQEQPHICTVYIVNAKFVLVLLQNIGSMQRQI